MNLGPDGAGPSPCPPWRFVNQCNRPALRHGRAQDTSLSSHPRPMDLGPDRAGPPPATCARLPVPREGRAPSRPYLTPSSPPRFPARTEPGPATRAPLSGLSRVQDKARGAPGAPLALPGCEPAYSQASSTNRKKPVAASAGISTVTGVWPSVVAVQRFRTVHSPVSDEVHWTS